MVNIDVADDTGSLKTRTTNLNKESSTCSAKECERLVRRIVLNSLCGHGCHKGNVSLQCILNIY